MIAHANATTRGDMHWWKRSTTGRSDSLFPIFQDMLPSSSAYAIGEATGGAKGSSRGTKWTKSLTDTRPSPDDIWGARGRGNFKAPDVQYVLGFSGLDVFYSWYVAVSVAMVDDLVAKKGIEVAE